MRERISQLASGQVRQELPTLPDPPTVDASIAYGQNYRGDIHFTSGNQLAFRGLIYSDDSRVILPQGTFAGTNIYIPYQVQAEELKEGTVLEGSFFLIYNGGEVRIPYHFEVMKSGREYPVPLETLEDFAWYANTNPQEAMDLFESREFYRLPFMEDMALRAIYDGLRRAVNHQNLVEEFLCGAGVKERVTLKLLEGPSEFLVEGSQKQDALVLTRNTWGFLPIRVECDHPAVEILKADLNTQDYSGEEIEVPFLIHREGLHGGKNYARICVRTPFTCLVRELTLSIQPKAGKTRRKHRERHAEQLEFWKNFLQYVAGKGDTRENLDYLQYAWEELTRDGEPDDHQKLYRAAISLWKNDRDLAAMILEDVGPSVEAHRREDVDAYCAYLYLQVQVTESWQRKEQMLRTLHHFESQGDISQFLFLLQLKMDEGLADRPTEMLERMKNYYEEGSRSPFLYLEACRVYNRYPDILKSLGDFELQALLFGARYKLLLEKTALYVASCCVQEHTYRSFLGRLLALLYEAYPKDEILSGLCSILIRGDLRDSRYFSWFRLGVERDIRLTRLYDYYLYTVPEDYPMAFPREILLYFSYNSPRNPESQLVLYRNLFRYYKDDAGVMKAYMDQLQEYVKTQIHAGRISQDLALIYRSVLSPDRIDEPMARILPDLLPAYEIRCDYDGFAEAILVRGEMEEEKSYPMNGALVSLPLYTDLCRVIFTDHEGNRYAGVPCQMTPLFSDMDGVAERCYEIYPRHAMTRLSVCTYALGLNRLSMNQARLIHKEMESRSLHRQYRRKLTMAYADYLMGLEEPDEEDILNIVRNTAITMEQRRALVEILVSYGLLAEAGRQVRKIGFRELPTEVLLHLVSLTIQNGLFEMDEMLLDMCYYLFEEGCCDEIVLEYLGTHFNSGSHRMYQVLEEITAKKLPTHGLEERLLGQMLFSDVREHLDRVFHIYLGKGVGDRMLIHAYFSVKCYDYFVLGQTVDASVFHFVRRLLVDEGSRHQIPEICLLALARYYAGQVHLAEEDIPVCQQIVGDLYRKGRTFAWMKKLSGKVRLPESLEEREWIEYHGAPDQKLEIHMQILPDMEGKEPVRMALPQVYPGIYVKSFLLFEGEELVYEITRPEMGRMVTLARDSRRGPKSSASDLTRFGMLNRLQMKVQDTEHVTRWQQDVLNYGMQETWTQQIFCVELDGEGGGSWKD